MLKDNDGDRTYRVSYSEFLMVKVKQRGYMLTRTPESFRDRVNNQNEAVLDTVN